MVIIYLGDFMNIDMRKYIISNFKDSSISDIESSIISSIESGEEEPLIGLGVLFELTWNNSDNNIRKTILNNINKGITK